MTKLSNLSDFKDLIAKEVFVTAQEKTIITGKGDDGAWLFDFRRIVLRPDVLDYYAELFFEKYAHLHTFQVGGLETAAIPLVSAIVLKSFEKKKPVTGFFIRKSRKKTGLLNRIEGKIDDSLPIVLVDDILNRGGSFMKQILILEEEFSLIKKQMPEVHLFTILRFRDEETYAFLKDRVSAMTSLFELNDFTKELAIKNLSQEKEMRINPYKVLWGWQEGLPHLWQVRGKSKVVQEGSVLYTGSDSGTVYALSAETGKEKWSYTASTRKRHNEIFSAPLITKSSVIFGSINGKIYSLSKEEGVLLWLYDDGDFIEGDIAFSQKKNILIASVSYGFLKKRGKLVALSPVDGSLVWEFETEGIISPQFLIDEVHKMVFVTHDKGGEIIALSLFSGKMLWKKNTLLTWISSPTVSIQAKEILVSGVTICEGEERGVVISYGRQNGEEIWRSVPLSYGAINTPVMCGHFLVITSLDSSVYVIDLLKGELIQTYRLGARIMGDATPFIQEGRCSFFVGANDARLYEIDINNAIITSTTYFTERLTNAPLLDRKGDALYIKTQADHIYKLSLR